MTKPWVRLLRLVDLSRIPSGTFFREVKATAVENFAWLPMGSNSDQTGRGSVSLMPRPYGRDSTPQGGPENVLAVSERSRGFGISGGFFFW